MPAAAQYRPLNEIIKQQDEQDQCEFGYTNRSNRKLLNLKGTTAKRKLLPLGLFVCLLLFYVMWCGLVATTSSQNKADLSYTGKSTNNYIQIMRESVESVKKNSNNIQIDGNVVDDISIKNNNNNDTDTSIMTSTFINKHTIITTTTRTIINATANNVPFIVAANITAVNIFHNSPSLSTVGMSKTHRLPCE